MKTLTKVVVFAIGVSVLQGIGLILDAFAAPPAHTLLQELADTSIALKPSGQPHEIATKLSQYSDNPTIPGSGTPGRTQGSGTR